MMTRSILTPKRTMNPSVLGSLSEFYRTKSQQRGSILDLPDRGQLELYPAGYTKPSERDNCSRQDIYKELWQAAVVLNTENESYPLGKKGHNIILIPDPSNEHDPNAIHVILQTAEGTPLSHLNGKDLGYVPKKINIQILQNMNMINGGRILKVRSKFHEKYWTAKIVLGYGDMTFSAVSKTTLNRFAAILDE